MITSARALPATLGPKWRLTLILGSLMGLPALSIDLYLPGLPTLIAELGGTAEGGQMSVALFLLGLAIGQLFYGPASDRFGRRATLIFGLCVYLAASLIATLSTSMMALILARLFQGLGACTGMVVSRAVVRDCFDHRESARFFSLLTLIAGMAPILAPSLGTVFLVVAGWRSMFGGLALFGFAIGIAVFLFLPETRSPETAAQARSEHPIRAYFTLLRRPAYLGYIIASASNMAAMFAYIATSSNLFIKGFDLSPAIFALIFGGNALGMVASSQVNRWLLKYYDPDSLMRVTAIAMTAAAGAFIVIALTGLATLPVVLISFFLVTVSVGLFQSNAIAGALSIDPLRAGSASALQGSASYLAGMIAASIASFFHDGTAQPILLVIAAALTISASTVGLMALIKK